MTPKRRRHNKQQYVEIFIMVGERRIQLAPNRKTRRVLSRGKTPFYGKSK